MLNFVSALPVTLEPNNIYYVQNGTETAAHYVADQAGTAHEVSSQQLVQAYMATIKGVANGYAELDGGGTIPAAQLPAGASPADISAAIATLDTSLQTDIALKANSADLYTRGQVDTIESGLQTQINGKQNGLANAIDLAKVGDSTFEGNPFVLLATSDW